MFLGIIVSFLASVVPTCQPGPAPDDICQLQQSDTAMMLFIDNGRTIIEIGD